MAQDPFLQVQQDVLTQLDSARPLFASYLRIRSLASSSSSTTISPELSATRDELYSVLTTLAEDVRDLADAVHAVERYPSQFGLAQAEVQRRQRLVDDVSRELERMTREVERPGAGRGGRSSHGAGDDVPPPSAFAIPPDDGGGGGIEAATADDDDDDYTAEFVHSQQQAMLREQDSHLDGVFQTVGNLRRQASVMGQELEEQREMLEVVDELADRVGGRLQTGMQKLGHIVRRNEDRWSGCCVGVLILVLVILLVLVLIL